MAAESLQERTNEDEWLWGWDPTPGIVSVWAEADGRATVWRRIPESGVLVREESRFRPWLLLDRLDDLHHLGSRLGLADSSDAAVTYRELDGPGRLRFLVSADDGRIVASWASLANHSQYRAYGGDFWKQWSPIRIPSNLSPAPGFISL